MFEEDHYEFTLSRGSLKLEKCTTLTLFEIKISYETPSTIPYHLGKILIYLQRIVLKKVVIKLPSQPQHKKVWFVISLLKTSQGEEYHATHATILIRQGNIIFYYVNVIDSGKG